MRLLVVREIVGAQFQGRQGGVRADLAGKELVEGQVGGEAAVEGFLRRGGGEPARARLRMDAGAGDELPVKSGDEGEIVLDLRERLQRGCEHQRRVTSRQGSGEQLALEIAVRGIEKGEPLRHGGARRGLGDAFKKRQAEGDTCGSEKMAAVHINVSRG